MTWLAWKVAGWPPWASVLSKTFQSSSVPVYFTATLEVAFGESPLPFFST